MSHTRMDHAEHCGWMVFTDRTVTLIGREADKRIHGLRDLGFFIKKIYCKPGLIPDDGYVSLFGETLRRLLEVAPADPFALDLLSRLGTNRKYTDLFIDITEKASLPGGTEDNGELHD